MIVDTSQHPKYLAFVSDLTGTKDFGECKSIAFLYDDSAAVVVYNAKDEANINMSIASTNPKFCNRAMLKVAFAFPFVQLGLGRVTAVARDNNTDSIKFLERVGFILEGKMRRYYENGNSALVYGLTRSECIWL